MGFPDNQQIIKIISGGGGFSAAITDTGQLYVCGHNKDGQLGLGNTEDVTHFSLCTILSDVRVSQVTCGWDFMIILTENGQLLSCGSNKYSQLGIPQMETCRSPTQIEVFKEKVVDAAAGLRHALALTESGHIFQWGTGLASQAKRYSQGKPLPSFLTAKEPCLVPGLENVHGKKVTAGSFHSVALMDSGELYVWGNNKYRQLLQNNLYIIEPHKITNHFFSGERIENIWSGWTHLVAQSGTGNIFTWGRANYGQIGRLIGVQDKKEQAIELDDGICNKESIEYPACIPCLTGASQIACGSEHNLAVCGNELYSWGWNEHGMCGNGSEENVPIPTLVVIPHTPRVKLIGCGAGHSMVLCISSG
ncbi:secretion-regulating guanine nucleotide exchange factor isoform X2 [Bombina bombina]|nr:secretion-regulating guanine nucleotide exchange factor isoform X2 [Bombina bombina]